MDRLSPLDAAFLLAEDEDPNTSMAIASVAVLAGPAPATADFVDLIRDRLRMIPRWRQTVRTVPLDLGRPVWTDTPDVDLAYHVRRTALPAPGDDAALCALVGRIMSQRMDRERPLWEIWMVEGLPDGRWAMLSKVHHCMVDGIAGTQLYDVICNGGGHRHAAAAEALSGARLILNAVGELASSPVEQMRMLGRALRRPVHTATQAMSTLQGLASYGTALLLPTAPTSLIGRAGRQRRYGLARVSMSDVVTVSRKFRVTINDVVLAALSGAFRELLLARDERPVADSVRTFVPVNVRDPNSPDGGNHISAMLALLPVDVEDPVDRLKVTHHRLSGLKAGKESASGATAMSLARHEIYAPFAWALRLAAHIPQRSITTVTTNVPGPRRPLSILGQEILEIFPYVPIALRLRTGIAIMSYRDQLTFGITADFDGVPDVNLLADAIEQDMTTLVAKARP